MAELQLSALLANLVHWEIHNPAKFVSFLVHVVRAQGTQLIAQYASGFLCGTLFPCGETNKAIRLQAEGFHDSVFIIGQEFTDSSGEFTLFIEAEPVGFFSRLDLHVCAELINLLSGSGEVAHHDCLDYISLEGAEAAVLDQPGNILNDQINSQIRLIGSISFHCLLESNPFKRSFRGHVIGTELGKNRRQDVLQHGEYIVLAGEAHLHIQLIELTGRSIASGVLVAEAGRDLEVAVEPGGHQKLFKLLGGLRQGVEFSGVFSSGYEVIACALGGGCGQDRGSNFQEAVFGHSGAQSGNDVTAEDDIFLDSGVSQI